MTTPQKRAVWLGILTAILGAISAPLLGAAWHSKADSGVVEQLRRDLNDKADRDSVMNILQRVDERTARMERYICRREPNSLGC